MARTRLCLDGTWNRVMSGRRIDIVQIPGSFRPTGKYELQRSFDWSPQGTGPVFLEIEGVASKASFSINGHSIGEAAAWVPYAMEVPRAILRDKNEITIEVEDITSRFGPMPGRRFDGLVRSLSLVERPGVYIENVRFSSVLNEDLTSAQCEVEVQANGSCEFDVTLEFDGVVVARAHGTHSSVSTFTVDSPHLWSPDRPALYKLRVVTSGNQSDSYEEKVGFRKLEIRERDFYLNNKRIVLKGICRHEFMTGYGYVPPEAEIRHELQLIRHSGFNYVRLVHSPHDKCVARLAAEIGLFVTQEPGTCFHDLGDETVTGPALETLRRMVLRDRNVPSIFGWFIYNECHAHTGYAVKAAEICRRLDPGCLISFADCFGRIDEIKAMVNAADLSFYGVNVYHFEHSEYLGRMKAFTDRPVLFTEWGGCYGQGNERVLDGLCNLFIKHSRPGETDRVAGSTFWAWADYEEYSRGLPASIKGWTIEGLVDKERKPKADLLRMSLMNFGIDHPTPVAIPRFNVLLRRPEVATAWHPLVLKDQPSSGSLRDKVAELRRAYAGKEPSFENCLVDGIPFEAINGASGPLLLGKDQSEIVLPVGQHVSRIAVIGHVAFLGGYPYSPIFSAHHGNGEQLTEKGTLAAEYHFVSESGTEVQRLEHGVHVLRSNATCRWWDTDLRATEIVAAMNAPVDPSFELLQLNLWTREWPEPYFLKEIRWKLSDPDSIQGLYALSLS